MGAVNDLYGFWKQVKSTDDSKVGDTKLFWLAPELILEEDGFNLRDYERPDTVAHIERLAQAWAAGAQMPPLEVKVKDGVCYVRDGHCRLRAAKLAISRGASIRRVSVIELKGSDEEANIRLLTSNNSLKLTPIQRATGYQRLRNMGWEFAEIAKEMKTSDTHVREMIRLLSMPLKVQKWIEDGVISGIFALKMYRKHGADEMVRILEEAAQRRKVEEGDDQDDGSGNGNTGTDDASQAGAEKPKTPRISSKHLVKRSRPLPKTFLKDVVPSMTKMRAHLESSAKPDSSGNVAVTMPIDVYESFMKLASMVDDNAGDEQEPAKNDKQIEIPA